MFSIRAIKFLFQYVPITAQHQKLSKIETLRLAKNYILALQRMLQTGRQPTPLEYAHQLSIGLSQTTTNMLANLLQVSRLVQPRLLLAATTVSGMEMSVVPPPSVYPQGAPYAGEYSSSESSFSSPNNCYGYQHYMQ
ncbi:unnamed protein product [Strongylus vulgaris]|uniref:BHLH domain-containing protein n=1 Tax=Strongylus vulgaris TaxID=40348 RepID=A0A3P7JE66_STRVU|nr:unnamed protein product [Strongylus vulgaris]